MEVHLLPGTVLLLGGDEHASDDVLWRHFTTLHSATLQNTTKHYKTVQNSGSDDVPQRSMSHPRSRVGSEAAVATVKDARIRGDSLIHESKVHRGRADLLQPAAETTSLRCML